MSKLLYSRTSRSGLGTDTPLLRTVSNVLTKFSYIFLKRKKLSLIRRSTGTKCLPQTVNSYKLNLFTTRGHCDDQVNPESRSGESEQGESRLADELCKVISVSVYQTTICERCAEEHNRLFKGLNNYK